jgi:hypothetical protein
VTVEPVTAATKVHGLEHAEGELHFSVSGPFGDHRISFVGDIPAAADPPVDTALAAALLPAMTVGGQLELPGPISPQLHGALRDIQAVLRSLARPYRAEPLIDIDLVGPAPQERSQRDERGVAAFFSGGVDSWSTVLDHPEVTDLVYVHGFDISIDDSEASAVVEERLAQAADALGKRLLTVRTNLRSLLDPVLSWEVSHGPALASVALLLEPVCKRVLIASSADYETPVKRGSHPLHDHLWSTERCRIEHDGAHLTRAEKIERIAPHQHCLDILRVCWRHVDEYNCGRCEKCLRTMTALEIVGALDRCPTFAVPLDVETLASLPIDDESIRPWWHENLDLARRRAAPAEMVGVLEKMLHREPVNPAPPERLVNLEADYVALQHRLEVVQTSKSWRLTAPIRRAAEGLRKARHSRAFGPDA